MRVSRPKEEVSQPLKVNPFTWFRWEVIKGCSKNLSALSLQRGTSEATPTAGKRDDCRHGLCSPHFPYLVQPSVRLSSHVLGSRDFSTDFHRGWGRLPLNLREGASVCSVCTAKVFRIWGLELEGVMDVIGTEPLIGGRSPSSGGAPRDITLPRPRR